MPALFTGKKRWNVGSDDFVVPAFIAIAIRLFSFTLTLAAIVALYFAPNECRHVDIPPSLYLSLFILVTLQVVVMINESVIFSISSRGSITRTEPRKNLQYFLYIRVILFAVEVIVTVLCTITFFSPNVAGRVECDDLQSGALVFAKVVVIVLWVTLLVFAVGFLLYLDPLGCCTPGLLEELSFLDTLDNKGVADSLPPNMSDVRHRRRRHVRKRSGRGRTVRAKADKDPKSHRSHISRRKMVRRMQILCCCLGVGGHRSRGFALEEIARTLHTLFGDVDLVASDMLAGLMLINKDQKKKKENCKCQFTPCLCLSMEFRDLTFESMPENHIPPNYQRKDPVELDFNNVDQRLLMEDLYHFFHYAVGIYGWTLQVFMNPTCGPCKLSGATCCTCNYRCLNERARDDYVKDNCCLCGVGSIKLQTNLKEEDILFVTFENECFQAPFSVCVDHRKKAIVVTVRGSLSIKVNDYEEDSYVKDALTNMTVKLSRIRVPGCPWRETYVHEGMYRTAWWIKEKLDKKQLLENALDEYLDYQLVVTGHSLGAGVASILAVLLKPQFPDLVCYAFSPPGCIFSFPLAVYSREFITSVVTGNDLVPRLSFRSLLHLKRQLTFILQSCKKPKYRVIFQPRRCDQLENSFCCQIREDPTVTLEDVKPEIVPRLNSAFTGTVEQLIYAKRAVSKWKKKVQSRGSLHSYVENVHSGQRIASFPPGEIIYIEVTKNAKSCLLGKCFPNQLGVMHMSSEDLCVINVDRGIVEDHLPNQVLSALHRCKHDYISGRYDPLETEQQRRAQSERLAHRRTLQREKENAVPSELDLDKMEQGIRFWKIDQGKEPKDRENEESESIFLTMDDLDDEPPTKGRVNFIVQAEVEDESDQESQDSDYDVTAIEMDTTDFF